MIIYLASDHAGFELKESVKEFLIEKGYTVQDMGADTFEAEDDYPELIRPVAEKVALGDSMGIIFGGSGQGEAIVCNRFPSIRATVYASENLNLIRLMREHNDANILSIGARFVSKKAANEAVSLFLSTKFSEGDRHVRRINAID